MLLAGAVDLALDPTDERLEPVRSGERRKDVRIAVQETVEVEDDDGLIRGDHLQVTAARDLDKVEQDVDDAGSDHHLADRLVHVDVREDIEQCVDEFGSALGCKGKRSRRGSATGECEREDLRDDSRSAVSRSAAVLRTSSIRTPWLTRASSALATSAVLPL